MFVVEVATILACGMIGTLLTDAKVKIDARYSSSYIKLTCTAQETNANDFMIHLSCPFGKQGFCFSNCTANCLFSASEECGLSMISDCKFDKPKVNQISTTYRINTALISQTGDWRCHFKNYKSSSITLTKYEAPTMIIYPTTLSTRKLQIRAKSKNIPTFEPSTTYKLNSTNEPVKSTPELRNDTPNWVVQHLIRPELVLALVVMLGFSLLLNLSFLIRCVLLKSVVDNYYRGIPNSSCILGCLCISQYTQKKRYSRSLNLSNQVGSDFYRCQPMFSDNLAIYDDLSAVSNSSARVKLRSNHSSDVDEEKMLTNLMSNGGSHTNSIGIGSVSTSLPRRYTSPSHAAYFHPGLGNYVIVSGPIATQDQYTIGAAPPGYALQMVSPIPSAPGSITGGTGANISVQSVHNDDLFDSDHSQTTNNVANQSGKINNPPIDLIDPDKILDLSQTMNIRVNGFNSNRQMLINQNNYIRSNGSVPLHIWTMDKVPPPSSSSVTSLPQYSVPENGTCIQDNHQMKSPLVTSSISNRATETTS